ncbi:peptide ABC transporter permease [Bacillus sp. J14TS2]|uniref:ABC transporter permease n=1 Tax=Bacillus sp. J14TS2 TaxID=2807188 RepID=UPI001B019F41|nr:ABC transporter permease [Bacillus sp. J14TS2]GIN74844.1 peptide ABC transporter permease [Bacillus sp. J14TS2]
MAGYLVRRTIQSLFAIFGAITIIFLIVRVIPGDPAAVMLGSNATREQIQNLNEALGLNEPLIVQYCNYIMNVIQLNFGDSFRLSGSALGNVLQRLPYTVTLGFSAIIFALIISFPLGIMAARKTNGIIDKIISTFSLIGQSLPEFWVGLILILIFARFLGILPSAGSGSIAHLILPSITLCLPFIGMLIRLIRNGILEEMRQGYVQTARSKGLREGIVFYVHVLRNALIPVITVIGLLLGDFIGSAVIIETVFAWPGIGSLLLQSILYRDYSIVQASVAVIVVFYVVINLTVDILYGYIDPRIKVEEK